MNIVVIGAGISGLSCATLLQRAGHAVTVVSRERPEDTVSAVSAAVWFPYAVAGGERVLAWAERSYRVFCQQVGRVPGVSMVPLRTVFRAPPPEGSAAPAWRRAVEGFRRLAAAELPSGYGSGYQFEAPLAEMPGYLTWLLTELAAAGGRFEQRALQSVGEVDARTDLVVHCSGLGARELVGDREMVPIAGQVVRVAQTGIRHGYVDDHGPAGVAYVVPRSTDVVLGGTAEPGREAGAVDPAVAASIVRRCAGLVPAVARAAVRGHAVGTRPGRSRVRLELETRGARAVLHDYGHGGSGMTLCWGCAEAVVALAEAWWARRRPRRT